MLPQTKKGINFYDIWSFQAKVKNTTADYYDLAKDEFTRSSGVAKVGIGIDNNVFGITLDGEYNTQGSDTKGTLGFRLIF